MDVQTEEVPLTNRHFAKVLQGQVDVELVPSTLQIHTFRAQFMEEHYFFWLVVLEKSFFLWIGSNPALLDRLDVTMLTQQNDAVSTNLLGFSLNGAGHTLSEHLARRTKQQVFVSYNVKPDDLLVKFLEKTIVEELTKLSLIQSCK